MKRIVDISKGKRTWGFISVRVVDDRDGKRMGTWSSCSEDGKADGEISINGSKPARVSGSIELREGGAASVWHVYGTSLSDSAYNHLCDTLGSALQEMFSDLTPIEGERLSQASARALSELEALEAKLREFRIAAEQTIATRDAFHQAIGLGQSLDKVNALREWGNWDSENAKTARRELDSLAWAGAGVWVDGVLVGVLARGERYGSLGNEVLGMSLHEWLRRNNHLWDAGKIEFYR